MIGLQRALALTPFIEKKKQNDFQRGVAPTPY